MFYLYTSQNYRNMMDDGIKNTIVFYHLQNEI